MHDSAYNFVRTVANMLGPRQAVCEFGSWTVTVFLEEVC
jgi:hypothetical protein